MNLKTAKNLERLDRLEDREGLEVLGGPEDGEELREL